MGIALAALTACGGGGSSGGDSAPPPGADTYVDPSHYSTSAVASLPQADEGAAVTHHSLALHGSTLNYTATAGHLSIPDSSGKPRASFFYVAYTLDGSELGTRPVTFFYNGGPGSASVWLHLGSFGPRRLVTGDPATTQTTPFPLVDNEETLLPTSDLVFVDAIGTGYSEAVGDYKNQDFWSVDRDAEAFRDFVIRYVAVNTRQASPKFLFGESYGTTRSGVLANLLEAAGVHLRGVVLQSSVLDYNANCGVIGEGGCGGYLPTYAAVGAYYQRTTPVPPDLWSFLDQMRSFTLQSYDPAVVAYLQQHTAPTPSLITTLASDTGASTSLWQSDFNLDPGTFQYNLLPGQLIGRYDARVSAPKGSPLASEGDPSSTLIDVQFGNAIATYLSSFLKYSNGSPYPTLSNAIETWDFSHDSRPLPDVVPDLAAALAQNPQLKVLSLNGVHDLATPFFQTEQDLSRLGDTAPVTIKSFAGGHMTYLDDQSRPAELSALQSFYQQVLQRR